jgi:phosphoglucosamine mutase
VGERQLFGTDGIRGRANVYPMTAEVALNLGRALGYAVTEGPLWARKMARKESRSLWPQAVTRPRVVIGKDTRVSCYMIEQAISAGVLSMGVDVIFVGPLPTPGIAFVTHSMRAEAGVVVSASHNSYEDNGIKLFGHDGFKLPDEVELELEDLITTDRIADIRPTGNALGRAKRTDDAVGRYIVYLKSVFPNELTLEGIRVVVDCANGAAYKVAPAVFQELGAEVVALGTSPDGTNINDGCGSLHPEQLSRKVRELRADIGIALDGDADRVIVVDEQGAVVDGDAVMAVCARELHRKGELTRDTLVATVMSNLGLERALRPLGINVERTQVGDRYVVERMRQSGFTLGGEKSGHLVFLDHATTGDGVVAALSLLGVMVREQRGLSELTTLFEPLPQELLNLPVPKKTPLSELSSVQKAIADVEARLGDDGRVLVRYSGTEMKARVMVEGPDARAIRADAESIADELKRALAAG